jgi:hypothetical protein
MILGARGRPVENEEANMRHASVVPWLVLLLASPAARARGARPPVGGGPGPLVCAVPDGQPPGAALPVRCGTDARARPKTVTLHYRSSGALQYDTLEMKRSPQGWWSCVIPGPRVTGKFLQYYSEAHDRGGRLVAFAGKAVSPNVISIVAPSPPGAAPAGKRSPAEILDYLLDRKSDDSRRAAEPVAPDTTLDALLEREAKAQRRSKEAPSAADAELDALFDHKRQPKGR